MLIDSLLQMDYVKYTKISFHFFTPDFVEFSLEMDSHGCLNESCVVRLRQQDGIKTPSNGCVEGDKPTQQEFSCSGVVIEPKEGLILTSGLVFAETLKKKPHGLHSSKKWNISTKRQTGKRPFCFCCSLFLFL